MGLHWGEALKPEPCHINCDRFTVNLPLVVYVCAREGSSLQKTAGKNDSSCVQGLSICFSGVPGDRTRAHSRNCNKVDLNNSMKTQTSEMFIHRINFLAMREEKQKWIHCLAEGCNPDLFLVELSLKFNLESLSNSQALCHSVMVICPFNLPCFFYLSCSWRPQVSFRGNHLLPQPASVVCKSSCPPLQAQDGHMF